MLENLATDFMLVATLLAIASFVAGFIDSIAGGGGLITMPALLLAGVPPQTALGTAKFAANLGTMVASFNFIRAKKVVWQLVIYGIVFSLIGSYVGAKCVLAIEEETVAIIVLILLPIAMMASFIPKKSKEIKNQWSKPALYFGVPLVCFSLGFYDGFFGPGAGTLLILAFHIFFGVTLSAASGTAKIFNLTSNIGATITFVIAGKCALALGVPMALANITGNYLGSKLVISKGDAVVKYALLVSVSLLLISLAIKFLT